MMIANIDVRRNPDAAVQIYGKRSIASDELGTSAALWLALVGPLVDGKALFPGPFLESPLTVQSSEHNKVWQFGDGAVRTIGERALSALDESSRFRHNETAKALNTLENLNARERDLFEKFGAASMAELVKADVRVVEVAQWREGDDTQTHVHATHKSVTDEGDADYRMLWSP